jgi:hypothetical protein
MVALVGALRLTTKFSVGSADRSPFTNTVMVLLAYLAHLVGSRMRFSER